MLPFNFNHCVPYLVYCIHLFGNLSLDRPKCVLFVSGVRSTEYIRVPIRMSMYRTCVQLAALGWADLSMRWKHFLLLGSGWVQKVTLIPAQQYAIRYFLTLRIVYECPTTLGTSNTYTLLCTPCAFSMLITQNCPVRDEHIRRTPY